MDCGLQINPKTYLSLRNPKQGVTAKNKTGSIKARDRETAIAGYIHRRLDTPITVSLSKLEVAWSICLPVRRREDRDSNSRIVSHADHADQLYGEQEEAGDGVRHDVDEDAADAAK